MHARGRELKPLFRVQGLSFQVSGFRVKTRTATIFGEIRGLNFSSASAVITAGVWSLELQQIWLSGFALWFTEDRVQRGVPIRMGFANMPGAAG